MCGIAALFSTSVPVTAEPLCRALLSLEHRGPDNQSYWVDGNSQAGLAHARLSLLDLSPAGNQPLSWDGGRLRLVHNGEFYDFERIKQELEGRGHRFRTQSDSEILLPLYEELGAAALERLRGEFAFVLWDRDNRSVFAARDRFGIKPLFYAVHEGKLHFASEVKALFAMGIPAEWDRETVYQVHRTWLLPPHRTLYKNIFHIPPGHYLLASAGLGFAHPRLFPYWDFDYPPADVTAAAVPLSSDPEEPIRALREKFLEAIRLRLRADVPVACYLSGGLDSCAILGAAAELVRDPIHAFTLSFVDDAIYDEGAIAREMAALRGAIYHEIPIRWSDLADNFSNALWKSETPFANTHGVAKYLLSRAVRQAGFKVVMTGEGSDEIFGGYAHFRQDQLMTEGSNVAERMEKLAEANRISRPLMLAPEISPALRNVQTTLGFIPSFMAAHAHRAEQSITLLRPELQDEFSTRDYWRELLNQFDIPRQLRGRERLHQSLYLWSRTMLPGYLLTNLGDRMEMAHSALYRRKTSLPGSRAGAAGGAAARAAQDSAGSHRKVPAARGRPSISHGYGVLSAKAPVSGPTRRDLPRCISLSVHAGHLSHTRFQSNPFYDPSKVTELLDNVPTMDVMRQAEVDGGLTFMLSFILLDERLKGTH